MLKNPATILLDTGLSAFKKISSHFISVPIFLPETMDTGIPETVEDVEKMDNTIAAKIRHQK